MQVRQAPASPHQELYRGMLVGMHAMAQPLTMLQSQLYLALTSGSSQGGEDALLTGAAEELESLCTLFRLLQQLVHMESVPAYVAARPFTEVLEELVEDAEPVFAGSGITFALRQEPGRLDPQLGRAHKPASAVRSLVLIDAQRTRQALRQSLSLARECASTESRIDGAVRLSGDWAHIAIHAHQATRVAADLSGQTPPKPLSEATQLLLASARAALAGQRAEFHFEPSPLLITVALPLAPWSGETAPRAT